jgi:hypothetical protein
MRPLSVLGFKISSWEGSLNLGSPTRIGPAPVALTAGTAERSP